jgi:hypothetical protein
MSRDFLLVLGGGVVSLITTLVVLFITDLIYRRDQARETKQSPASESLPQSAVAEESKT